MPNCLFRINILLTLLLLSFALPSWSAAPICSRHFKSELPLSPLLQKMLEDMFGPETPGSWERRAQENLLQRFGVVIEKGAGANLFHGSGSASLVAVFRDIPGPKGLIPSGDLIRSGNVPFAGEMYNGISQPGVANDIGLSAVRFTYLDMVAEYLDKGLHQWSKRSSLNYVAELKSGTYVNEAFEKIREARINVELRRQELWDTLPASVKALVSENFPVLYALKVVDTPDKVLYMERGNHEQVYIIGGVAPENITAIFVPKDKIEFVRSHLLPQMTARVEPIESILANKKLPGDFVREFFP